MKSIMSIKRTFIILAALLACGIIIFLVYLWVMPSESHTSRLAEEQSIYSTIINGPVALEEKTSLGFANLSGIDFEYLKNGLPELQEETWLDFQKSNKESYPIKDYLSPSSSFVLLSDTEAQIYQDGWKTFYKDYPAAYGIIALSRIGFNSSFSQALVLKGYYGGSTTGDESYTDGRFIFLQKIHGTWTMAGELIAWIS